MLLGLDIGTSSAKAILLSSDGQIEGEGAAPYAVLRPRPGWAESDPGDWWQAAARAARQATSDRGDSVEAIGLSGQMHGLVLTGAQGDPLRPAILWADTRSTTQLEAYQSLSTGSQHRLANPLVTGMAGPSLLWLRDNEPEVYRAARWALQPKDWLRLSLTGEVAAEPSDASATLLYDLQGDGWALDTVEALGLRAELLAPLLPSEASGGALTSEAADHLGVRAGIPVAMGAGDTPAAALGTGLLQPGAVQLTVGTAGQIVAPLAQPDRDPAVRTHLFRAAAPDHWYAMAAIQNAGLALEWARGVLGVTWDDVYGEAMEVPPGSEGLSFLPYLTGERTPVLDPSARGAWAGLALHHTRADLLRAALEGVAFALREGMEALEERGIAIAELRLAGGGTTQPSWRQLLANVLRRPLLAVPDPAASARGAALLSGIAVGRFADAAATLAVAPTPERSAEPDESVDAYEEAYVRYREIYPALRSARTQR